MRNGFHGDGPRRGCGLALAWLVVAALGCHKPVMPHEGKSVAQLEAMLRDPDPQVQVQGALGLSLLGPEASDATPTLMERLASDQSIVRANAALALGKIGPAARAAVPLLTNALHDAEWTVRRQAALALGGIGADARPALPSLEKLQRDPDSLVSKAARKATEQIRAAGG